MPVEVDVKTQHKNVIKTDGRVSKNEPHLFWQRADPVFNWTWKTAQMSICLGVFDQIHSSFDKRTTLLQQQTFTDVQKKNCSLFFFTSQL